VPKFTEALGGNYLGGKLDTACDRLPRPCRSLIIVVVFLTIGQAGRKDTAGT
jgi:hypothetical protein